jgi:hypothetical protein
LILGGDFNVIPSSGDLAALRTALPHIHAGQEATYMGDDGYGVIDFFCSSVPLNVEISVSAADGLSDHNIAVASIRDWAKPASQAADATPSSNIRMHTIRPMSTDR